MGRQRADIEESAVPHAKRAAVCISLERHQGDWKIPLIRRNTYPGVHSGQISLPGGKIEENELPYTAALREFEEEMGVSTQSFMPLGKLSNVYIPPSNFYVYPFLTYNLSLHRFNPDPSEVVEVIYLNIMDLIDDESIQLRPVKVQDKIWEVPCYLCEGHTVWGATALILSELAELCKKAIQISDQESL